MAYPALLVSPFAYRQNFRAQELRQHGTPNGWRFMTDSDAHATTIAATVAALSAAQQTSLVKRIGQHNLQTGHPEGTRYTLKVLLRDSTGAVWRVNLRNWKLANPGDYVTALFTGVASADTNIVALSAAPSLPNSGNLVASVSSAINALPGSGD